MSLSQPTLPQGDSGIAGRAEETRGGADSTSAGTGPAPLTVVVYDTPAPQGSKTRTRYAMYDDNAKALKPWREAVKTAALDAIHPWTEWDALSRACAVCGAHPALHTPYHGPVSVEITFTWKKPKSAPKRRRTWPITKPDIDKLQRSTFDSLTAAGVWRDDSQVIHVNAWKAYPGEHSDALDRPGVLIRIQPISEGTPA